MKYARKFTPFVLGTCLLAAVSCGSDDDDSGSGSARQEEQQPDQGIYIATLTTLNANVEGGNTAIGIANITVEGDQIMVDINMDGVADGIAHAQHIHSGTTCPDMSADENNDGFVDVLEGVPSYGPILVPLDGDLSSQEAGATGFPTANNSGSYEYSETALLSQMIADLRLPDANPDDATTKLPADENLNLAGRHIVIHGVATEVQLPGSVQTIPGLPANATLPIACGEIIRVLDGGTTGDTGTTTGDTGTTTSL